MAKNIKDKLPELESLGFDWSRLHSLRDGTFSLDLANIPVQVLPPMEGLPISELYLQDTKVSDLTPIHGLPLRILNIARTSIRDLDAVAGIPLAELNADGTKVANLLPLRGMPLRKLDMGSTLITNIDGLAGMQLDYVQLNDTSCSDIEALRGQPIRELHLRNLPVNDLAPVARMPLEVLDIAGTKVTNIEMLAGMPLNTLDLGGLKTDLRPLEKCPHLEILSLPNLDNDVSFLQSLSNLKRIDAGVEYWVLKTSAEDFWKKHEVRFARRRPIDAALAKLGVTNAFARASLLADGTIDLDLSGSSVSNLSSLQGFPISRLDLSWTAIRDVSPLIEMPLKWLNMNQCKNVASFSPIGTLKMLEELYLSNANIRDLSAVLAPKLRLLDVQANPVDDLSPLKGTAIEQILFFHTSVTDCGPLLSCPNLLAVQPSEHLDNLGILRKHASIQYIDWWYDRIAKRPRRTSDSFWADLGQQTPTAGNLTSAAPSTTDEFIKRIAALWDQGHTTEAIAEYRALTEKKPGKAVLQTAADQFIKRIAALWDQGRTTEATAEYHALNANDPGNEVLQAAQLRFSRSKWTVIWFPSKAMPKKDLEAWRALAGTDDAVSAEMPWLDFRYGFTGLRGLDLGPEINRKAPGPEDFGMIAKARLTLPVGLWRFALRSDDGCRLIINGKTQIEKWDHQDPNTAFADWRQNAAGPIDVIVEYFQEDGNAQFKLMLEPIEDRVKIAAGEIGDRVREALIAMHVLDTMESALVTNDGRVELSFVGTGVGDLEPLRGLPVDVLILTATPVIDLSPLIGTPLRAIYLDHCSQLSDIGPLSQCSKLASVTLRLTNVRDLGPLRGLHLRKLSFADTAISDLEPLRGMPLETIHFARTEVRDASPLRDCPHLREIEMSTSVTNVQMLRELPKLEYISSRWDGERPAQSASEFWGAFDVRK